MNDENKKTTTDDPRITAYVFGELTASDQHAFEAELASSDELRKHVEETRSIVAKLQGEFESDANNGVDARCLDEQQRSRLSKAFEDGQRESARSPASKSSSWRARQWAAVATGAVAICLAVAIWFTTQPTRLAELSGRNDLAIVDATARTRAAAANHKVAEPTDGGVETAQDESLDGKGFRDQFRSLDQNIEVVKLKQQLTPMAGTVRELVSESAPLPDAAVVYPSASEWSDLTLKRRKSSPADLSDAVQLMVTPGTITIEEQEFFKDARAFGRSDRLADDFLETSPEGEGSGNGGDKHDLIVENEFLRVADSPLSTFSIDVDTASYSKIRMYLDDANRLPRRDVVRIEELINYFPYQYEGPEGDIPFAARQQVTECPWNPKHRLVRVAIKGKEIDHDKRPLSNLVFLLDVSGSMNNPNKLPLLKRGMKMLVDQLGENDRVAIVVYAGAAGLVLESTTGDQKATIVDSLNRLNAGGSTNGGQGIQLAYQTALDNFIPGGTNRVVLCTDGDFNVGTTGTDQLVQMVEDQAKANVFISVLGFGMGNHNDSMLEQISNKGNGNYAFVDTDREAKKVLVEQLSATLITIAKDVKIQVEFNPTRVAAYRLIGYENRVMAAQDFNDDTKDAGEIGAGHSVTAFYELILVGEEIEDVASVDDLKYQESGGTTPAADSDELLTLKLRFKQPEGVTSKLLEFPLKDEAKPFATADKDFQFASSVASFGMLLRGSKFKGNSTYASVIEIAQSASADDPGGYRSEFVELVRKAKLLAGE